MSGRHTTPSRWRKRILGLPIVVWLLGGVAATALAVVGFIVLLGSSGSVTSAPAINVSFPAIQTALLEEAVIGDPVCDVARSSASQMAITITNAEPGDRCFFRLLVRNDETGSGGASARLQAFKVASTHLVGTVGTCGQTLAPNAEAGVEFHLTVGPTFPPGGSVTFVPATDGLEWRVSTQYVAGQCQATT